FTPDSPTLPLNQLALLVVWSFIAGFSERLAPGLLERTGLRVASGAAKTSDRVRPTPDGGGGTAVQARRDGGRAPRGEDAGARAPRWRCRGGSRRGATAAADRRRRRADGDASRGAPRRSSRSASLRCRASRVRLRPARAGRFRKLSLRPSSASRDGRAAGGGRGRAAGRRQTARARWHRR